MSMLQTEAPPMPTVPGIKCALIFQQATWEAERLGYPEAFTFKGVRFRRVGHDEYRATIDVSLTTNRPHGGQG